MVSKGGLAVHSRYFVGINTNQSQMPDFKTCHFCKKLIVPGQGLELKCGLCKHRDGCVGMDHVPNPDHARTCATCREWTTELKRVILSVMNSLDPESPDGQKLQAMNADAESRNF
jgi:hypothetical protein